MKRFPCSSLTRLLGGAVLLLCAGFAQAQYVWINANGTREYSDKPPPPSVPRAKILKTPQASLAAPEALAPAAGEKAEKKAPTLAEREADYRKRQQERAAQEQKAAEQAKQKEAVAENCEAARQYKAQLESGIRLSDVSPTGERSFVSDEERSLRLAKARRVLEGCR